VANSSIALISFDKKKAPDHSTKDARTGRGNAGKPEVEAAESQRTSAGTQNQPGKIKGMFPERRHRRKPSSMASPQDPAGGSADQPPEHRKQHVKKHFAGPLNSCQSSSFTDVQYDTWSAFR
jgi:hypothetical protein